MMSSQNTSRKTSKSQQQNHYGGHHGGGSGISHKNNADWPKAPDGVINPKIVATAEQIRIAQIINDANKSDDPDLQKKIEQVMELTGKSGDTIIIALHDCDNDPERAVNMLLEGTGNEGEWELSVKKKKNRQAIKQENIQADGKSSGNNGSQQHSNKENHRSDRPPRGEAKRGADRGTDRLDLKSGLAEKRDEFRNRGPPRLNRGNLRNWRNKENEKNERNLEESMRNTDFRETNYDSRLRGSGRRGRGGRNGEGGRGHRESGGGGIGVLKGGGERDLVNSAAGSNRAVRTFQNRALSSDGFPQSIDTWTNSTAEQASEKNSSGVCGSGTQSRNWPEFTAAEDWSEEDWTEGLNETKVFTPSSTQQSQTSHPPSLIDDHHTNTSHHLAQNLDLVSLLAKQSSDLNSPSLQTNGISSTLNQKQHHKGNNSSSHLSGQSQFSLSQYAQQAAESIKAAVGITSGSGIAVGSSGSGTSQQQVSSTPYSSVFTSTQQVGGLQRDLNQSSSMIADHQHQQQHNSHQQQLQVNSLLKNNSLPSRPKSQRARLPPPSKIPESAVEMPDNAITALDVQFGGLEFGTDSSFDFSRLSESFQDNLVVGSSNHLNQSSQQTSSGNQHGLMGNNSGVSSSHSTSNAPSLVKESNVGTSYSGTLLGSGPHLVKELNSTPSNSGPVQQQQQKVSESMLNSKGQQSQAYSTQRSNIQSSVEGSYSSGSKSASSSLGLGSGMSSNSSTGAANYIHQSASLSNLDTLGNSQSSQQNSVNTGVYLGSHNPSNHHMTPSVAYGLQQNSAYTSSAQTNSSPASNYPVSAGYTSSYTYPTQQGSFASSGSSSLSSTNTKLGGSLASHDAQLQQSTNQLSYDGSNQQQSLVSSANNMASAMLQQQQVTTASSTNTTSVLKNSLSARKTQPGSGMALGVASTAAVAATTPTAMMGHHQYIMGQAGALPFYGYYDMQFSAAPTSLTGRDPNMGSVAYTGGDVKFSRADSNDANSVVTTLSQGQAASQQQSHGQTFLNPTLHPGYGYYFPGGVMPGSIPHYAAPPMFPVPSAGNTHGASSTTQYQKANTYGSHSYGTGFGNTKIISTTNSSLLLGTGTTPDLSNSIYSKSHQQLTKASGPIGNSSTQYATTPFIPVLAHSGQHPSALLHHHMESGNQSGVGSGNQGQSGVGNNPGVQRTSGGQPGMAPKSNKQPNYFWGSSN